MQKTMFFGDTEMSFVKKNGKITKLAKVYQTTNIHHATDVINNIPQMQNNNIKTINIACGNGFFTQFYQQLNTFFFNQNYNNFSSKNITISPAMTKLYSFICGNCDAFFCSNTCKDWDVLPAIPILNAMNAKYVISYRKVYDDNNFNQPLFFATKNNKTLHEAELLTANIFS